VIATFFAISYLNAQSCSGYVQPANELVKNGGMEFFSKACANLTANTAQNNLTAVAGYPSCFWVNPPTNPTTANVCTPDYFNTCAPVPTTHAIAANSVNGNLNLHNFNTSASGPVAYMPVSPHLGNGYSGINVYQNPAQQAYSGREYICNQLVSALSPNSTYQISMWVRLAPNSLFGIKDLSILFSNTQPAQTLQINVFAAPIPVGANDMLVPVSNAIIGNVPITTKNGWVQLTANITAPAGSNFSYITIGNFKNNNQTTISAQQAVGNVSVDSYYYIDDVSVKFLCGPTLNPTMAGATSFCLGSPISFTGSETSGTVANNVWTVVECSSTGIPLAGAIEWWSPWAVGAPGTLTLPSSANGGPTMTCGKYYKVKLAVQNPCVVWAETAKIITINCPPSFKLKGSTSKICTGDIALLNATMNAGSNSTYTLNWTPISPAGPSIYNGPLASVTVSPTVPTTYLATVTDNVTGCSSIMQWFVNVVNNDPTFSLNINTIPATYFTMALSANDPYGYINSGFYYSLIIEELDGSGNPYYQDGGTDCWWNYPYQETFQGYVSTGTGTFSQGPWGSCPAPAGQFLYNHTYRITRGVWNDQCTYRQFAMIITTVKSGGIEVVEDPNAPDYSALSLANAMNHQAAENTISIYPNPSNGLYTIELADCTDASIEIYNVLGKKVKSMQQTATKTTVDLTGFPKGIYFVNTRSNGELISKKIILE